MPDGRHMMRKQRGKPTDAGWAHVYDTVLMIKCTLLSNALRHDRDLQTILRQSLHICLPPHLAEPICKIVDAPDFPLPSPSAISRFRLSLDSGLMCFMRSVNSTAGDRSFFDMTARCVSSDSSEQLGQEWLVGVYSEVSSCDLIKFAHHADNLFLFYKQVVDDIHAAGDGVPKDSAFDAVDHTPDDVTASWDFVLAAMKVRALPIAGLGARHMGLIQKVHAHWHSIRTETFDWSDFCAWLASVFAHTSDMGTELAFADTKHDPEQLLGSSFSPVSFSSGVAEFCESPGSGDEAACGVGGPGAAEAFDIKTCDVCGPGVAAGFAYLMCLNIAGILHILHNATKDVLQRMEHFMSWYYPMLKALCAIFNKRGWRNLIVNKCYSDLGAALYAASMRTFHPKNLSERWGVLISAVGELLEMREPFEMCWDEKILGLLDRHRSRMEYRESNRKPMLQLVRSI